LNEGSAIAQNDDYKKGYHDGYLEGYSDVLKSFEEQCGILSQPIKIEVSSKEYERIKAAASK